MLICCNVDLAISLSRKLLAGKTRRGNKSSLRSCVLALKQGREGEGAAGGWLQGQLALPISPGSFVRARLLYEAQTSPRAVAPCCAMFVLSFFWEQSSLLFLSVLCCV